LIEEKNNAQLEAIEYIILGYCLNKIKIKTDKHGYEKYALVEKDEFDDYFPKLFLAKKITESHLVISNKKETILLKNSVYPLPEEFKHKLKKEELVVQITNFIKDIVKPETGGDSVTVYGLYRDKAREIISAIENNHEKLWQ
jgi:hypothetical protein